MLYWRIRALYDVGFSIRGASVILYYYLHLSEKWRNDLAEKPKFITGRKDSKKM
jgi:hypothetical protein